MSKVHRAESAWLQAIEGLNMLQHVLLEYPYDVVDKEYQHYMNDIKKKLSNSLIDYKRKKDELHEERHELNQDNEY